MNKLLFEFLIICFYFISLVFLPILIVILSVLISNGILYIFAVLIIVWVGLAITPFFSLFINIRYLKNVQSEYKTKKEYIGIVITTDKLRFSRYFFVYFSDIMLLIEYMKRTNQPFKLLKKFDKKKFDDMVYDKNCAGLYILGHGRRHGLLISEDEILYYCEYVNAPKKDFVVQLHCNHMKGKSLGDYLCAKEDFLTDKMRTVSENREYVHKKLKKELNLDAIDVFVSFLLKIFRNLRYFTK